MRLRFTTGKIYLRQRHQNQFSPFQGNIINSNHSVNSSLTKMYSSLIHRDRRHALRKLDRRWQTRLNLRLSSLLLTILAIIAFAASIPTWQASFFHASGGFRGDWTDGVTLIPLCLILFTDVLVISHTIRFCHPPRAFVVATVEAIILVILAPALTLAVLGSLFIHFSAAIPDNNGTITCSALQNMLSRECSPILYTVGSLQVLGVVFGWMLWLLHLSLAIWASLDVRRNRQRTTQESTLERRRRRWREERVHTSRRRQRPDVREMGQRRTGTGAYENYGWYR